MITFKFHWNSCFWKFSRNRLVDDELPPGDSSVLCDFLGSYEELPSGQALCRKETQAGQPSFLGFDELPGSDEQPPSDTNRMHSIWMFFVFLEVSDRGENAF